MPGTLYVVATPIGNLKDMTLRGLETLKDADLVVCEDTRRTRILLDHFGIKKPLLSLFQAKERKRTEEVLEELRKGKDVALVSDAGTPTIQDPGFPLVRSCVKEGIEVQAMPGPSALLSALTVSGLPTNAFIFEGFLPYKAGPRQKKMESWKNEKRTVIFYESPYRIVRMLEDLKIVLGNVSVVIARELTKKFEEVIRGTVEEVLEHYKTKKPKGEFVVLLNLKES